MKRTDNKTGQRIALVVLLFVGVLTVGVGFVRVRARISGPFTASISKANSASANPLADAPAEDIAALKARDTDGDGLSDYDELYVYHTSPYLKDTDSDGFDDKQEIDTGHDPNCATGKVCFDSLASTPSSQQLQAQGTSQPGTAPSESAPLSSTAQADLEKLKNLTPAQVRALFKEKGFTDAELKDLDDETLVSMYRQSLEEAAKREQQKNAAQTGDTSTGQPTGSLSQQTQITPQQLAQLPKEEIIKLLKDTGELSQDQLAGLEKLDDKTVRSVFLQALTNAQNTIDAQKGQ